MRRAIEAALIAFGALVILGLAAIGVASMWHGP